jgi:hypothetical protein
MGPVVEEEVFRPWWELFVPLVEVTAIVTESARAARAITNSPDGSAPDVAVRAAPSMPFSESELVKHIYPRTQKTYPSWSPPSCPP